MFVLAYYDREASITITNFIIYETIKSEINQTARFQGLVIKENYVS